MPNPEEIVKELLSFTLKQWMVIATLATFCVGAAFWVEDRYAKIKVTEQRFSQNQQQLDSAYFLALEMFSLLPENEKKAILEKLTIIKK
ncbi:MAG: hypothetical protein E4H07_07050 [Nitrosomonadales bacterium]|nr:MAG: hypothetical protein E4H07_07050 [Nitrosomonadales bacterium]